MSAPGLFCSSLAESSRSSARVKSLSFTRIARLDRCVPESCPEQSSCGWFYNMSCSKTSGVPATSVFCIPTVNAWSLWFKICSDWIPIRHWLHIENARHSIAVAAMVGWKPWKRRCFLRFRSGYPHTCRITVWRWLGDVNASIIQASDSAHF